MTKWRGRNANRAYEPDNGVVAPAQREQRIWPGWVTPGWYVAERSALLARGTVKPLVVAGRQLALARTISGKPMILDRYCAHQGASLAAGQVVGERVQCPFHHWQYDYSGVCIEIPGCAKIPPKGYVAAHPVRERFGFIWLFVGEPGAAERFPLPEEIEFPSNAGYRIARSKHRANVSATPRDIVENIVDESHFKCVHGIRERPPELTLSFQPNVLVADWTIPILGQHLSGRIVLRPPAFWFIGIRGFSRLRAPFEAAAWLFTFRPMQPERTDCFATTFVEDRGFAVWNPVVDRVVDRFFSYGFDQDIRIWTDKVQRAQPVLCANDAGPIQPFRKWWAAYEAAVRSSPVGNGVCHKLPIFNA